MEPGLPASSLGGYGDECFPVGTDAPVGEAQVIAQRTRVGQDLRTGPERKSGILERVWGNPRKGTQIRRLREGSRVLVCGSISGPT